MEKKRKKLYKLFTKWSLSYVVLSVVAIVVISFCAMKYTEALREDLEYTNAVQLQITQLQLDRNVRNLRNFCSKANLNQTVKTLRRTDSIDDISRYELYELVRDLANERLLDEGIHDNYLYFPAIDLMVSGQYYNESREFYDIALGAYGFYYEDWYEAISKDYKTAQIISLDTVQGEPITLLIKPLDSNNRQTPPANAIMVMDLNEILKTSEWLSRDRNKICMVDRSNKRIVSGSVLDASMEEMILSYALENTERSFQNEFSIGASVASCIPSQYENWDYVVITEEQSGVAQISELQRLVVFLIFIYLIISAAAIGYASFRHYKPLKNLLDVLEKQEVDGEQEISEDAYEYISKSVHKLVDKNRENSSVINQQRNAISRELFHRLLTESNAYASLDDDLIRQSGISLGGGGTHVLCISI